MALILTYVKYYPSKGVGNKSEPIGLNCFLIKDSYTLTVLNGIALNSSIQGFEREILVKDFSLMTLGVDKPNTSTPATLKFSVNNLNNLSLPPLSTPAPDTATVNGILYQNVYKFTTYENIIPIFYYHKIYGFLLFQLSDGRKLEYVRCK
jgi:hypothetical protein